LNVRNANSGHRERYSTLLKFVAIQGNVWCVGHVIAFTACPRYGSSECQNKMNADRLSEVLV